MTTKKKNKRQGKNITAKEAEEMFILWAGGMSKADISRKYKRTKAAITIISKRYKWEEREHDIALKVTEKVDEKIVDKLVQDQEQQLETIGMLLATIYGDIKEDFENASNPIYKRKIKIDSTADIERVFKTLFMVMNRGVEKTENSNTMSGKFEITKEDRKMLLKALATNKAFVVDDDDGGIIGNA